MSIGLAAMSPREHQSVEHLVSLADRRLFAAKRWGRNRFVADLVD